MMLLTDEQISLMAHNEDEGDWNDLRFRDCWHKGYMAGARAAEERLLAKLASAELPEPSIVGKHKSSGLSETGYTADQLRQAYAQGAASQLSAEPEAWTWNTKSQHDGTIYAEAVLPKGTQLFTLKEPK